MVFITSAQATTKLVLSLAGGVTEGAVSVADEEYSLLPLVGNTLWGAEMNLKILGTHTLNLRAQDGAGNKLDQQIGEVMVRPPLAATLQDNSSMLTDSLITVEQLNPEFGQWVAGEMWQAPEGIVSRVLPPGTWRLLIQALNVPATRTEPLTLTEPTLISGKVSLSSGLGRFIPRLVAEPIEGSVYTVPPIVTTRHDSLPLQFLEEWRGRAVLVTTIALWNRDSLDQLVHLSDLQKSQQENLAVLPVLVQQTPAQVAALLQRGRYSFIAFADETGQQTRSLSPASVVTHHLFDEAGILRATRTGFSNRTELEAFVRLAHNP